MKDVAMWVAAMVVFITIGVLLLNFVRGRQRLAELKLAAAPRLEAEREVQMLTDENAGLRAHIGRLDERIATLERIVTDPAERTAREIEELR